MLIDSDSRNRSKTFMDAYFGLIIQSALLIAGLIIGIFFPMFYRGTNLLNVFYIYVIYALLAIGSALPTYVRRIDLSGGAVLALTAWIFAICARAQMPVWGFAFAIAAGLAVGIINGVINSLIRIPSPVLTMAVSGAVTFGVSLFVVWIKNIFMNGWPVIVENMNQNKLLIAVLVFFGALAAAAFLVFSAKLGKEEKRKGIMTAYIGSAAFSALAGCFFVLRTRFAHPSMGSDHIIYLVFVAGSILVSRTKRFMPVMLALLAAMNWSIISNICNLANISSYILSVLQFALAALFITAALLVRRRYRI